MEQRSDSHQSIKQPLREVLRRISRYSPTRVPILLMARAGLLPPWVWGKLPVERNFAVSLPGSRSFVYSSTWGDSIGRALYWRGIKGFEFEVLSVFMDLARKSRCVLDIGANTGLYSLVAAAVNPEARVIAFEPVPKIARILALNFELNGWKHRCEAVNQAVSNSVGSRKLHVPHAIYGDCAVMASLNTEGFGGLEGSLIDVPVTTVDAACETVDLLDLVKIDVEGFEDKVLEGMHASLSRFRPAIVVEIHHEGSPESVQAILSGFGYSFYDITPGGVLRVDRIPAADKERNPKILCTSDG